MKTNKMIKLRTVAIIIAFTATSSFATLFTASGTGPDKQAISASANFLDLGGGKLQVTVANTYSGSTYGIAEVLYGIYFNGATGLSLESATTAAGTYKWDLADNPPSMAYGNEAVGNISGTKQPGWSQESFGGENGASALGHGYQEYGLVSEGFTGSTNKAGGLMNSNHNPYLQNSVVFDFSYTSLSNISDVTFTYGTDQSTDLRTSSVPEPSTVIAGALILLPFGISTLRILRKNKIS